jgi:hypothetical protein
VTRPPTIQESIIAKLAPQVAKLHHTRQTFSVHPDLVVSIPSFPKSKGFRIRSIFGVLNDEMSATDPKPVKEAQGQERLLS